MSWIDSVAPYIRLAGLLLGGVALAMGLIEGKRPTWGGVFRLRPIWRQREDFSSVGWVLWVTGISLLFVYLFLHFIWPRTA